MKYVTAFILLLHSPIILNRSCIHQLSPSSAVRCKISDQKCGKYCHLIY